MKNFLYKSTNAINRATRKVESTVEQGLADKHDKYKSLLEMVTDYGYPIEKHFYETKDNYINTVYRISGPRFTKPIDNINKVRPVVIY